MLERLFGSKTRIRILKIFLINPDNRYLLNELSKHLKLQLLQVKKELENLEKFGIIQVVYATEEDPDKAKQERKYYQVNRDFILFDEIKALLVKAQILYEEDFINKLTALGKIKLLILTGVFVNEASPIDLLIVGHINRTKLLKLLKELEKEMGKEINFSHFEANEYIYRRNLTDVFLYEILERKKLILIDELDK